jgi:hypothetical protein
VILNLLAVPGLDGKEGVLGSRIISEWALVIVEETVAGDALQVGCDPLEEGAHVSGADLRPAAPDVSRLPHLDTVPPSPPEIIHPVNARAIIGPPGLHIIFNTVILH